MLLPGLCVPQLANFQQDHWGTDCAQHCLDPDLFANYAHDICYSYNSRGFRDVEWPQDRKQLHDSIWCVGDSFTTGVGLSQQHTWPCLLQQAVGHRCINVSMDGASNVWIARQAAEIAREIKPQYIVVQWSYLHRREQDLFAHYSQIWQTWYQSVKLPHWPNCAWSDMPSLPEQLAAEIAVTAGQPDFASVVSDFDREIHAVMTTDQQDLEFNLALWQMLQSQRLWSHIIYSTVPDFAPDTTKSQWQRQAVTSYREIVRLDLARDGHHYGVKTAQDFVAWLAPQIIDFRYSA